LKHLVGGLRRDGIFPRRQDVNAHKLNAIEEFDAAMALALPTASSPVNDMAGRWAIAQLSRRGRSP